MHKTVEPAILYLGTPVVLVSTLNEDGTANVAPISSAFWLGWRCVIGLAASSKTFQNLMRTGECVLNLPSEDSVIAVDRLALTTALSPVPDRKRRRGYRYEPDKFRVSGFTPVPAQTVAPPRVRECPIQLEAVVAATHGIAEDDLMQQGVLHTIETRVQRVHAEESILMAHESNRIDPDAWRPLIMSFQKYYGLGAQLHPSTLATIPESMYRTSDIDRARTVE